MPLSEVIEDTEEKAAEERPLVESICLRRALMSELEGTHLEEIESLSVDEVIKKMDFIQLVNDLSWFSDDLPGNVQKEKIISDTLCRSDILVSIRVKEVLSRKNLKESLKGEMWHEATDNPIKWLVIDGIQDDPPNSGEERKSLELRYLNKAEKSVKNLVISEGTNRYKFAQIIKNLSNNLPFSEESLILYLDEGIRPIMPRWKIRDGENDSYSGSTEVCFNTNMIKTNDFQMLKAKIEEMKGSLPTYIDRKDYILFQIVWYERGGPPEVQKMKSWKEILDRLREYGVEKWSSHHSVRSRWQNLKKKIQADEFGKEWVQEKL